MALPGTTPLLILPQASVSSARVECVECGGSIDVDLTSPRVRALVEALADIHACPDFRL